MAGAVETVAAGEAPRGTAVGGAFKVEELDAAVLEGATPGRFVVPAFISESTEIVFAT